MILVDLTEDRVREFGQSFKLALAATDPDEEEDLRIGAACVEVTNTLLELALEALDELDAQEEAEDDGS